MSNSKARCPVCGRFQFRLIPGSECYCACGTRFLVGHTGDERSLQLLHVPVTRWRPGLLTFTTVKNPAEEPSRKTNRFT
ncbi:MAG: hypothetical protein EHM61_09725 [Acidobacteria bacterium]|nr:MAG: hypothetical protein EHM61_09725 [Acidobacteriota bacterium]